MGKARCASLAVKATANPPSLTKLDPKARDKSKCLAATLKASSEDATAPPNEKRGKIKPDVFESGRSRQINDALIREAYSLID